VRVEKEGYRPYEEATGVSDVTLQIAITPVSRARQKMLPKEAGSAPTTAPANPANAPKPSGLSDNINLEANPTLEVRRRLPTIEFSFVTSGNKRQEVRLSVVPEFIQLEPKPTGVKESDLPKDVPVTGGTVTVLRFGQEGETVSRWQLEVEERRS
jgi:hypothetical protein